MWNIEQQNTADKQEVRAKRRFPDTLFAKRKKTQGKFTQKDLEEKLEEKREKMERDKKLPTFEELFWNMQEQTQQTADAKTSYLGEQSPRESDSHSFFEKTPRGNLDDKTPRDLESNTADMRSETNTEKDANKTPRPSVPGLDLGRLGSIKEIKDDDSNNGGDKAGPLKPASSARIQEGRRSLVQASPHMERAQKVLADRSRRGVITDDEEGTNRRDLPDDEFKDFLNTYEDSKWWMEKAAPSKQQSALATAQNEEIKEEDEEKGSDSEEQKSNKAGSNPFSQMSES